MTFLENINMMDYKMPCGWEISLPSNWIHECDIYDGHDLCYPPDSDLTIHLTCFHAEKQGTLAPIEVMETAFLRTIPTSSTPMGMSEYIIDGFSVKAFENISMENGKTVFSIVIGYYTVGELLSIKICSTDKQGSKKALTFLKTLQKI